ncbi:MAG: aspartate carbamoyltransferase regulatory subunit [Defluviitaleaceae bacterium]|nr:aspartate carbamoyltransferase regulatory subunit [Defluviitaleaceae bacterium]
MEINSIANGIVIDHIRAGFGLKVLEYLKIDKGLGSVAIIMNAVSEKHGRKDLIKLENVENVDVDVLGLIDHNATVIYIKNDGIVKKAKLSLPEKVTNVILCKNPRCVTSVEAVPHVFHLADASGKYRCEYCDNMVKSQ